MGTGASALQLMVNIAASQLLHPAGELCLLLFLMFDLPEGHAMKSAWLLVSSRLARTICKLCRAQGQWACLVWSQVSTWLT